MGRRRSVRFTRRGRSRPRVQACKNALLRGPHKYRGSELGTARHESRAVQVLWDLRRMSVPGAAPTNKYYLSGASYLPTIIDVVVRDTTRSQAQRGREGLSELLEFVSSHFRPLPRIMT
jgi:hypothetical protein